jgi:hypothetical protein
MALTIGLALGVLAAAAFFLWMFLAAAPIEALADAGGLSGTHPIGLTAAAYGFAADWRHGMAGNSPLYMPGFFLLAVATWLWSGSRVRSLSRQIAEGIGILLLSVGIAWACAGLARAEILGAFERSSGLTIVAAWPAPPRQALVQGVYTAIVWMASMVACRRALEQRTFAPLLFIPPMTIVLALIRPWTVDDFAALWIARARAGDMAAIGSLAAIPIVAAILIYVTRRPQWVQIQRSDRRIAGDA